MLGHRENNFKKFEFEAVMTAVIRLLQLFIQAQTSSLLFGGQNLITDHPKTQTKGTTTEWRQKYSTRHETFISGWQTSHEKRMI